MSYCTLHGSVAFVFSFPTCAITNLIAHLSMGVNVLTLNKYMISLVFKMICSIDRKRGPGIPCLTMHEAHVELCWCDD